MRSSRKSCRVAIHETITLVCCGILAQKSYVTKLNRQKVKKIKPKPTQPKPNPYLSVAEAVHISSKPESNS